MKLLFQSEVTGYSSIIKTKTSHSIKHLRLNANKIGSMENLLLGYRLSSRCYNFFTCTTGNKKLIVHHADAYFTKENMKMFPFALNFSLSIFQTVKLS